MTALRRHPVLVAVVVAAVLLGLATAVLFVWPRRDTPAPADAIVVLNGDGHREQKGIELAQRGLAPVLVFSEADPVREPACRLTLPHVKTLCFAPSPATTQGESEAIARLATQYGWHRILVVVSRPQASRARLRLRRCYAGRFEIQTVPVPLVDLPWSVAYEWGAMVKALVWQRQC